MTDKITIIAKNITNVDIFIKDLGQIVSALDQITISETNEISEIYSSDDLLLEMTNENIVLNDGVNDLNIADATNFLQPYNKVNIVDNEVQASDIMFAIPAKEQKIKNLIYTSKGAAFYISELDSRNNRVYKFFVDMNGSTDTISLRLWDSINLIVLGELIGISSDGVYSITFTKPIQETDIDVQVKKDTDNSLDPILETGMFIYTA